VIQAVFSSIFFFAREFSFLKHQCKTSGHCVKLTNSYCPVPRMVASRLRDGIHYGACVLVGLG
jgi:hypothetical protein